MSSDKHNDLRAFMEQTRAQGRPPAGKRMVLNPVTGKFEVQSVGDRPGDNIPQVDAEDMKAFSRG
ncbi:hypothetical protein V7968_32675 [Nocardia vulneris]|uniref:hypothetical protein n=1 Tax=Nocardia vulneris TaxID=1141657 RepID=UPI0030D23EA6